MKSLYALLALAAIFIAPTGLQAANSYGYTTLEGVTTEAELCANIIKDNTVKNKYITAPAEVHLTAAESNLCT